MSPKMAETESSAKTLWIVSARMSATVSTVTRSGFVSGFTGTVSVTTTLSRTLSSIRSIAGGEKIPCVELCTGDERSRGVDHVVGHDGALPLDVADDVRDVRDVVRRTVLLEHGEVAADHLGELARQACAARVGRDGDELLGEAEIAEVLREHRQRGHVVDGYLEEPLHLARVEIHRQHAVGAGRLDHLRDELRGDRLPRTRFLVLPRVGVERDHGRDPLGRGELGRVDHDQQLHQVLVDRRRARLDDEEVGAANRLLVAAVRLAARE